MLGFLGFLKVMVADFFVHCHSTAELFGGRLGRMPAVLEQHEDVLGLRQQLECEAALYSSWPFDSPASGRRFDVFGEYRPMRTLACPT